MIREIRELRIEDTRNLYHDIVMALIPHREKETCSIEFIVEGTKENPLIGIRYPGRKVIKRKLKTKRANSAEWGNLLDFLVIPYVNGKEAKEQDFTFERILKDFEENKAGNEEFWNLIEKIYFTNKLIKEPPKLPGINSKLFLLVLKWIWIQEDFNYRLSWKSVRSPIKYILLSKKGNRMGRGAGRAKFFAALILLKHGFTFEEIKKIIPLYA